MYVNSFSGVTGANLEKKKNRRRAEDMLDATGAKLETSQIIWLYLYTKWACLYH
jgi:hypothetical protein